MLRKKPGSVKQINDGSGNSLEINELEHPFISYLTANLADLERQILENKADKSYLLNIGTRYKEELQAATLKLREISSFCFHNSEISMTYKTSISENERKKFKILMALGYKNAESVPVKSEHPNPYTFYLNMDERKKYQAMLLRGYTDWECVPAEFTFDGQTITLTAAEIEKFEFLLFEKYLQVDAIPTEIVKDKLLLSEHDLEKYKYLLMSGCKSESIPQILEVPLKNKVFTSPEYYKIYGSISTLIVKNILRQPDLELALLSAERWIYISKLAFENGDYFTASIIYNSIQSALVSSPNIELQKISYLENELSTQGKSCLNYLNTTNRQKIRLHAIQKQQFFSKSTPFVIPNLVAMFSKAEEIDNSGIEKNNRNQKIAAMTNMYKEMQTANSQQGKNASVITRVMFKDLLEYHEIKDDLKEAYRKNACRNHIKSKKMNHQGVMDNLYIYNSNDKLYACMYNLSNAKAKLASMLNQPEDGIIFGYNKEILKAVYDVLTSPEKDDVKLKNINTIVKMDDKRIQQSLLNEYHIIIKELELLVSLKYHRWEVEGHPDSKAMKLVHDKLKESSSSKDKLVSIKTRHPNHAMVHRKKGDSNIRHSISSVAELEDRSLKHSGGKEKVKRHSDKLRPSETHLHSSTKTLLTVMADDNIAGTDKQEVKKLSLTIPEYTEKLSKNKKPGQDVTVTREKIDINGLVTDRRDAKANDLAPITSQTHQEENNQTDPNISQLPALLSHRYASLYRQDNPDRGKRVSVLVQNIEQLKADMDREAERMDSIKAKK